MFKPKVGGSEKLLWYVSGVGFSDWGNFYDHQRPHTTCYLMAHEPPPLVDQRSERMALLEQQQRQGSVGRRAYLN